MKSTTILIITLLILCFFGAELYGSGVSQEELNNITQRADYDNLNFTFTERGQDANNTFLSRVIYKGADFYGFIVVGGARKAINYGYDNPQYNYNFAWKLLFVVAFASLIIPLLYVILFIGYFIKQIIDWYKKRRKRLEE